MHTKQQLSGLDVVEIRYLNATESPGLVRVLDAYGDAGAYGAAAAETTVTRLDFEPDPHSAIETDQIGTLNGQIATQIAAGRRAGKGAVLTGGNCCHITGVIGGLQSAHGPQTRIGLVWFDAHGDFNTPHTSLSGMLGGMPVAVAAGLAFPRWRERSQIVAPLPTDRILMVDVRNLDEPEEQLIRSTDVVIAAPADGYPGEPLPAAVTALAERCDLIYLHIDSDILDERYVPNHKTKEPSGPSMEEVLAAAEMVLATGKVGAVALVSIFGEGDGSEQAIASGTELLKGTLAAWGKHGQAI